MHEDNHFAINNLQYVEEYLSSIEQKIGHLKVKNYITILVIPLFSILISVFGIVYKFDEVARYTVLFHFVWYLIISMIIIGILYGLISHAIAIVFQKGKYEEREKLINNIRYTKLVNQIVTSNSLMELALKHENQAMKSIYAYESIKHLEQYLNEIAFRISDNKTRTNFLDGIKIHRLNSSFELSKVILTTLEENFSEEVKNMGKSTLENNRSYIDENLERMLN